VGNAVKFASLLLAFLQDPESQSNFCHCDSDANNNKDDDNPSDLTHFCICYTVTQDLSEVKEDATAFIEDFNSWSDFEVLAYSEIEWMKSGFRFPEKVRNVKDI
jgi:hypothetical protein